MTEESAGPTSRLRDRTILVTGATGGIGGAQARMFVAHGADVVLADIDADRTAELARSVGGNAISCRLDVREEEDWSGALELAVETFGRPVTGMINNAAIGGRPAPITEMALEQYLKVVNTDQVGTFLALKMCGAHMIEAGVGGSLVAVSSVMGLAGHRNVAAYVSAKFAVRGLTRTAALDLAAHGIRVNCICPGTINTEMLRGKDGSTDAVRRFAEQIPQGEVADPSEIAYTATYLLSDESRYVTGTDHIVDGGMMAAIPFDLGV